MINEQDKDILGIILNDNLEPLKLTDIENLEIAQESISKWIQLHRWSLMIEKINTPSIEVDKFKEITEKINMCTLLLKGLLGLNKLRLEAIKKMAENEE